MAKLTAATRKRLPSSAFGLPGTRQYPEEDAAHAKDARGRATQQQKRGNLTSAQASRIRAKADRILGRK